MNEGLTKDNWRKLVKTILMKTGWHKTPSAKVKRSSSSRKPSTSISSTPLLDRPTMPASPRKLEKPTVIDYDDYQNARFNTSKRPFYKNPAIWKEENMFGNIYIGPSFNIITGPVTFTFGEVIKYSDNKVIDIQNTNVKALMVMWNEMLCKILSPKYNKSYKRKFGYYPGKYSNDDIVIHNWCEDL